MNGTRVLSHYERGLLNPWGTDLSTGTSVQLAMEASELMTSYVHGTSLP